MKTLSYLFLALVMTCCSAKDDEAPLTEDLNDPTRDPLFKGTSTTEVDFDSNRFSDYRFGMDYQQYSFAVYHNLEDATRDDVRTYLIFLGEGSEQDQQVLVTLESDSEMAWQPQTYSLDSRSPDASLPAGDGVRMTAEIIAISGREYQKFTGRALSGSLNISKVATNYLEGSVEAELQDLGSPDEAPTEVRFHLKADFVARRQKSNGGFY